MHNVRTSKVLLSRNSTFLRFFFCSELKNRTFGWEAFKNLRQVHLPPSSTFVTTMDDSTNICLELVSTLKWSPLLLFLFWEEMIIFLRTCRRHRVTGVTLWLHNTSAYVWQIQVSIFPFCAIYWPSLISALHVRNSDLKHLEILKSLFWHCIVPDNKTIPDYRLQHCLYSFDSTVCDHSAQYLCMNHIWSMIFWRQSVKF